METVQPIRDLKKIDAMKKVLSRGPYGKRNLLLFVLGINSALRISDLLAMKLGDVVTEKKKVRDFISVREIKTKKTKRFRLNGNAAKAIKSYVDSLDNFNMDEHLFLSRKGDNKAISRVQAWEILNNAAREVGLREHIGTHTLRKTFGYHAHKAGESIEKLQIILNHRSPRETRIYLGITQDEIDEVYATLNL